MLRNNRLASITPFAAMVVALLVVAVIAWYTSFSAKASPPTDPLEWCRTPQAGASDESHRVRNNTWAIMTANIHSQRLGWNIQQAQDEACQILYNVYHARELL